MFHVPWYLPGRPVVGFFGFFEADFGDPSTPRPYARVTPSRVGFTLLPFWCPRCGGAVDFSDATRREHYRDARPGRGNYFCPRCGYRFYLGTGGRQAKAISGGVAPYVVERVARLSDGGVTVGREERGGKHERARAEYLLGCDLIVAIAS